MNEFKTLLLHLDASPRSALRLRLAAELAARHDAVVDAAYAATPMAVLTAVAMGEGSAVLLAAATEADEQHRLAARKTFDQAHAGPRVHWKELEGDMPLTAFVDAAYTADLLVLGQDNRTDPGGRLVPEGFAQRVIVQSGKPAIVIPQAGDFERAGRTVLVAWKRTRESARALAAALPLLAAAQHVHVASWGGEPRDVERMLARHGITALYHHEPATHNEAVGDRMLSLAADFGVDLLVMGLYGHSRAREWVLGGASRTVLESMTMPVLLAH
jgi:nucleotide-binding universal stress UspA family protein